MVLAAAITELGELETAGGRLLVLGGGVIALFALSALQCDDFPHLLILPNIDQFFSCQLSVKVESLTTGN
jgi:hypothetical protein